MTKPVWSQSLALSAWTLKKAHIITCQKEPEPRLQKSACKSNFSPTKLSLPNHT